uniref:C2H2-type domain-containing protein n=1 Tax=Plectus sambesii TaxID=2011161 RepID=A0A914W1U9_9BILA
MGKSDSTRCPECRKEFMHGRNLMQHRRVAHLGVRYYCEDCSNSYTRQYNLTHHRIRSHPEKVPEDERQLFEQREMEKVQHAAAASSANLRTKPVTFNTQQQYLNQLAAAATQRARFRKPIVVRQFVRPIASTIPQSRVATINGVKVDAPPHVPYMPRFMPNGASARKGGVTMVRRANVLSMVKSRTTITNAAGGATATAHIVSKPLLLPTYQTPNRSSIDATISIVSKAKAHRCPRCSFSTTNSDGMRQHSRRHGGEVALGHRCSFCDYSVESTPSLMMHTAVHFSAASTPLAVGVIEALPMFTEAPCVFCGRRFTSIQELSDHERFHTA